MFRKTKKKKDFSWQRTRIELIKKEKKRFLVAVLSLTVQLCPQFKICPCLALESRIKCWINPKHVPNQSKSTRSEQNIWCPQPVTWYCWRVTAIFVLVGQWQTFKQFLYVRPNTLKPSKPHVALLLGSQNKPFWTRRIWQAAFGRPSTVFHSLKNV